MTPIAKVFQIVILEATCNKIVYFIKVLKFKFLKNPRVLAGIFKKLSSCFNK